MVELNISIVGAQQSAQQIQQVTRAEQELVQANETLDTVLLQTTQGLQRLGAGATTATRATTTATAGASRMTSSLESLASVMSTVVGLGAIKQVHEFAKAWLEVGARGEVVANQFKVLEMIRPGLDTSGIEQASKGLATQRDLIGSINKASFFGFDLSKQQLEDLVRLSTKTAMAMGEDVTFMFNSLITGTARESELILDNLGIIVDMKEVYGGAAQALGKTADEMSKTEKQTALLSVVIAELEKKTSNIDFNKLDTKMQSASKKYKEVLDEMLEDSANFVWDTMESFGYWLASDGPFDILAQQQAEAEALGITYEELMKRQAEINRQVREARPLTEKLAEAVAQLNVAEIKRLSGLLQIEAQQAGWLREKVKFGFDYINKIMPKAMVFSEKEAEQQRKIWEYERKQAEEAEKKQKQREKDWEWSAAHAEIGIDGGIVSGMKTFDFDALEKELSSQWIAAHTEIINGGMESGMKTLDTTALQQQNEVNLWAQHYRELSSIQAEFDTITTEVKAQNNALRLQQIQEYLQEEQKMMETSYGIFETFARNSMDAILTGQAEKIPLILANQSYQTGMELFWDGVKTLWMGTAKNALFPGLGADAMTVGLSEMAIGGAMAGAGAIGAAALGGATSSGGGSAGANERSKQQETTINVVSNVSLYGSKKEAQRELKTVLGG